MSPDTWVEVSKDILLHNLREFKRILTPGASLMFVVKANAYGHGLSESVRICESADGIVDAYGVHTLRDGVKLRDSGIIKDIYVLGYVSLKNIDNLFRHSLIPVITNIETLHMMSQTSIKYNKPFPFCIKCETGTYRQGIYLSDVPEYAKIIKSNLLLKLNGLSTHFANIEDTTDHSYAKRQISRFEEFLSSFANLGISPEINHIACSAAIILFYETHYQLVRAGISAYGLWPSKSTYVSHKSVSPKPLSIQPVLSWKTIIGQIKHVKAGSSVGYGCTYKTEYDSKLAILPVGYYDGYDRRLSNIGYVLVRGKRAPIRGRVCMNMTIIDVTHIPEASLEDEVILIGRSGDETITADTLAEITGTINYEIISRINPGIPRRIT